MASPFIWKAGVSVWEFYTVQSWSPQNSSSCCYHTLPWTASPLIFFCDASSVRILPTEFHLLWKQPSVNLQPHIKKIYLLCVDQAVRTLLSISHVHTALWRLFNVYYELENKLQLFYDIQTDICESTYVLPQQTYLD